MEVKQTRVQAALAGFDAADGAGRIVLRVERIDVARHAGRQQRRGRCEVDGHPQPMEIRPVDPQSDDMHAHRAFDPEAHRLARPATLTRDLADPAGRGHQPYRKSSAIGPAHDSP